MTTEEKVINMFMDGCSSAEIAVATGLTNAKVTRMTNKINMNRSKNGLLNRTRKGIIISIHQGIPQEDVMKKYRVSTNTVEKLKDYKDQEFDHKRYTQLEREELRGYVQGMVKTSPEELAVKMNRPVSSINRHIGWQTGALKKKKT